MEESLKRSRASGNQWSISGALNGLGRLLLRQGETAPAAKMLRESLALALAQGARQYAVKGLLGGSELAAIRGDFVVALRLLGAMSTLCRQLSLRLGYGDQQDIAVLTAQANATLGDQPAAAALQRG